MKVLRFALLWYKFFFLVLVSIGPLHSGEAFYLQQYCKDIFELYRNMIVYLCKQNEITMANQIELYNATNVMLALEKSSYHSSAADATRYYKSLMVMGRGFPTTRAQAKFYLKEGCVLDILSYADVAKVEAFLTKHRFEGVYRLTKGKHWARLESHNLFVQALKREYNL